MCASHNDVRAAPRAGPGTRDAGHGKLGASLWVHNVKGIMLGAPNWVHQEGALHRWVHTWCNMLGAACLVHQEGVLCWVHHAGCMPRTFRPISRNLRHA